MKQSTLTLQFNALLDRLQGKKPVVIAGFSVVLAALVAYFGYGSLVAGVNQQNISRGEELNKLRSDNNRNELLLKNQAEFEAEFEKVVKLYVKSQPLLPTETELAQVLEQLQESARRHNVVLAGLNSAKERTKSATAQNLYEREMPAIVTGNYDDCVRFFYEVSNLQRILLIRDFSIVAVKKQVSVNFSVIAFHAPKPKELPPLPANLQPLIDNLEIEQQRAGGF